MCDCDCYDNVPVFYRSSTVKGRKEYHCCECLRTIPKGELHEYAAGLWEGAFDSFRTCGTCTAMRDEIDLTCYCHSMMMEVLDERDYPGVTSVAEFLGRRRDNYTKRRETRRDTSIETQGEQL